LAGFQVTIIGRFWVTAEDAASVTAFSVLRACPSTQCSTPKVHQQTTEFGNEKRLKFAYPEIAFLGCLFNFISFICSSVIGSVSDDCHDSPL
jgi:hypothetical protein